MLKRFYSYYRPYSGLFVLDFGCAVLAGLLELAFPLSVAYVIDKLLPQSNYSLIIAACAGLLAIYLVSAALKAVVNYFGHVLGVSMETDMRRQAFDHMQKLSFRFFDNHKTGHLITHVTKDLEDVGEVAHHGPEDVFIAIMTFIGAFALMFFTNWKLAMIAIALVPVMSWLVGRYGSKMTTNWQELFRRVGDFNVRVEDAIGGIRVVKAFANESHESGLFQSNNLAYRKTKLEAYAMMTASLLITFLSTRLVQLVIMLSGAWLVVIGELTYGGFVSFLLLVDVFLRPIDKITGVLESYPKGIAGFKRFTTLIDTEPDIADRPDAIEVDRLTGHIRYEGVSFAYDSGRSILRDVNLDIPAGETVAIVGPSGAGKTTLCSLLPRFYEPTAGRITVDGIDIADMTQASLRKQIGVVQQDVFLFGGTLRDNIAYGDLTATDADIIAAAKRARLEEMIAGLPAGLDTVVGERGVKLSGGQKQRVAIARIFLKNPPILILDEATSALDTATEAAIQQALNELSAGRTTLIIAHRLATVRHAHRIVVLTENGIAEQGAHDDLLSRRGIYSQLHSAQQLGLVG
ncbi:multidrug ABC transporter ATP-binding protein [Devosia sp. Leaf420]|uniref:ABC transporter ATP-binding protein n=1 Tax=Devosia sp. Leaf420 TaxID=1736374 RepID=UPI000714C9A5|nr:ABC transporter ATP-binding protein [Devosia sp. Leaf420]KQT51288.1 multidrug ABC transporter ATP-binding protein [Devosia sp. Leaf420]